MRLSVVDLIAEIHTSISAMQAPTGKDVTRRPNNKPDLEKRIKYYNFDPPTCCSEKDFHSWLTRNYGAKACCFCADCTPEFKTKMKAAGTCNCPDTPKYE